MPIVNMNIEKDVEKASGLNETEYLDKDGRIEKHNQTDNSNPSQDTTPPIENSIVKPKIKKPKSEKQLQALARAREAKLQKKLSVKEPTESVEYEERQGEDDPLLQKPKLQEPMFEPKQTYTPPPPKLKQTKQTNEIDYEKITNSVFERITARQEKQEAEKRAKLEYENKIRLDEREKILSEYKTKQQQNTGAVLNRNTSVLDPNKFLRPKTHGEVNWDMAFRPR